MKRNLLFLCFALTCVAIYLVLGGRPDAMNPASASYLQLQPGPFATRWEEFDLVDNSRPTPMLGDVAGSEQRRLRLRLWRPEGLDKPAPLVLYSHGFMSNREGATLLAEHLASHGWLVAAPDFPLSCYPCVQRPTPLDVVNQPADISFTLDELLRRNADAADALYQSIDPLRVAAVGYSLGGFTTQMLAFHPRMADSRVKAAVSIAGPSAMLGADFFHGPSPPFMMVAGTVDALVGYAQNAQDIVSRAPGTLLVSLLNGSHAGFSYAARFLRYLRNPDQVACWMQSQDYAESDESHWYRGVGGVEQGIKVRVDMSICQRRPLPAAMNLLRQQQLTLLAVRGFLDCQLEPDHQRRQKQCDYLFTTLPADFASVRVDAG